MAKAGLSFASPILDKMNIGEMPNPYAPFSPTSGIGLGGLGPSLADIALVGEALSAQAAPSQFTMPEMRKPPGLAFNPSSNELFVQGATFSADDAAAALESEKLLSNPAVDIPTGGGWIPISEATYQNYLESIRNPSLSQLAKKNFGRGIDQLQLLGGRLLQLAGAEELGGRIVEQQQKDLAKTAPYERTFTDIESGRDAVEWFVANFAQQGPNLIEAVTTAGLGFLAGSAVGGPLAGAGGLLAGLLGKKAFKEAVTAAAKKKLAGETLNAAEEKLLREAAGIAGATAASYGQNLAIGAADIYNELREQGADADDVDARIKALLGSIPYAALDTLPEFLLASRIFGGSLASRALAKNPGLVKRAVTGATVGGLSQGGSELGQEALLLGLSDQDLSSPESINRLINSFAAGFGVGGPIGAVANLNSKQPQNLLNPAQPAEPTSTTEPNQTPPLSGPGTALEVYTAPVTPITPTPAPEQLQAPSTTLQLPSPTPPVQPAGEPYIPVTPSGGAFFDQPLQQNGNVPPTVPGTQGVLDVFNEQISAQELASRMQPPVVELPVPAIENTVAQPVEVTPGQGVLPFFDQQPPVTPTTLITPTTPAVPQATVETGPTTPVQLPLFSRRQAPLLRRGVAQQTPQVQPPQQAPQVPLQPQPVQLKLFNAQDEPTLEALKSAGQRRKLPPVESKALVAKPRGKRGLLKQAGVSEVNILPKEVPNAVQESSTTPVYARSTPEDRSAVGEGVPSQGETPRKGEALKKRQQAAVQKETLKKGLREEAQRQWPEYADPELQPKWDELTPEQQQRWIDKIAEGKPSIAAAEEIAPPKKAAPKPEQPTPPKKVESTKDELEQTDAEVLEEEIKAAEEATDTHTFKGAIETVLRYAFFAGESTNIKKVAERARAFIKDTKFGEAETSAMDDVFVALANTAAAKKKLAGETLETSQLEAAYKGGSQKGQPKPWFTYALSRNLLSRITTKIVNVPAEYKSLFEKPASATKMAPKSVADVKPEQKLAQLIDELIFGSTTYRTKKPIVKRAKELYAQLDDKGREYIVRGYKLKDYFKSDGTPKILKTVDGRYIITTKELSQAERRALEKEYNEQNKRFRKQIEQFGFIEDDWDSYTGEFYRADGTEIKSTIPAGRVRLLVASFLRKLRVKPNVFVYANVEELKTRNPDLYRRAAAARKEGDFDTTKAAGYSFGPNVILFTDFIRTEQQLKFILAHETLGHFGFRSVVPEKNLKEILTRAYDASPDIQAAVDAAVATRGIQKLEAIEEYLADHAAEVETSIIVRVWNAIKNFLNKLGFEFQDDEARYLISLARRYVRRGNTGNFVTARSIVDDLKALDVGRFATVYHGDLGSRVFAAGALNRRFGATGGLYGAMDAFAKKAFGARQDVPGTIARLLEHVQTLDNKARRSYGLNMIYRLLEKQHRYARGLLSKYQRMTAFTHSVDLGFLKKGVTEAEKERAGELLARAALLRAAQATDEYIKSFKPLVKVDDMGNVTVDPQVRKEIQDAGFVTAEEFRKGFDITYSDGSKVRFQYDVDENSPEWKVYKEIREAVNEAAIDMMLANYEAAQSEATRVINELNIGRSGTNVFTADDLAAIRRAAEIYKNKRYAGSDVANAGVEIKKKAAEDSENFLIAFGRALFNDDIYKVWVKDPDASPVIADEMKEFLGAEYDDLRAQLPSLRAKIKDDKQSFKVQKAIRDLFLFDLQSKNAEYYAKRTILGSYVPFSRRGTEQVKLVAVDARGNYVALDEHIKSTLPYFQFNSRSEALDVAKKLDELFGDDDYVLLDENGNEVTVRLKAEVSRARQSPDLTEAVNFNEFVYVLNRLNINITPEARERIVTILTGQNARARHNLQRSGTEGWDKDVIRSVSEFLETTAHVAAKKLFRHRFDDVMFNNAYWLGDDKMLADLEAAVRNAKTDGERARAQRAYDQYAYMYRYMKGSAGDNTVVINGKEVPTLGRGEDYREEAKRVLRWYSDTMNIADSTEDFLSGETGSRLKLITVLMQLGGSVATAVTNLASLVTHSLPYLSYYNPTRAFGGGYGQHKAMVALWRAAKDVKDYKLADSAFLKDLIDNNKYDQYNLTEDEAKFLFAETEQGTLQAAQFNALLGTARGKVFNNKAQAAVQAWMSMFAYTEQFNRRVTALAAYRLEKERLLAQNITDQEQLFAEASEAARIAVNSSQGEYAMFNRPEMARGHILQYIFVYKQFVIITVQLLRSLPFEGQRLMLGLLFLMSGLKGIPFAEDIFDIIDTIAQKLGLKMASVEKEIAEWLDSIAPGVTPYVMRGVLDHLTGATLSSRFGMGDLIPLSGAAKAGADPYRELTNFVGPVYSGIAGLVGMAGELAKYGAEVLGLRDDTTSFNSIMRNSPIAAVRAIADSMAYLSTGAITNNRGQIVSSDAPYHVILARLLGFYPAIATQQNDIVRMSKEVASYARAIKAEYVSAYVKASLENDRARMREIENAVREWNRDAEGTGLEIRQFIKSANRAAREAARPTALRYLKAAPKKVRPETEQLLEIFGLEDVQ